MQINLLEVLQKTLGTNGLTAIAGFLGDSPAKTEESFFVSVAVVLRELAGRAKPGDIWNKVENDTRVDPKTVLDLPPQVIRSKIGNLGEIGSGLFTEVFGEACEQMVTAVSSNNNCSSEKATSNLGLATIYTISALRKWGEASQQPKQAIQNLLEQQKRHLTPAVPVKAKKKKSRVGWLLAPALLVLAGYLAWPHIAGLVGIGCEVKPATPLLKKIKKVEKIKTGSAPVSSTNQPETAATMMNRIISSPDKAIVSSKLSVSTQGVLAMDENNSFIKQLAELMQQKKEGSFQIRGHVYTEKDLAANSSKSREVAGHIKGMLAKNGVPISQLSSVGFGSAIPTSDKNMQTKIEFRYLAPSQP